MHCANPLVSYASFSQTKMDMANEAGAAFFSITQAEYAAGDFRSVNTPVRTCMANQSLRSCRSKVIEACTTAEVRVESKVDNVAGVKLPVFSRIDTGATAAGIQNIGLGGGGKRIEACKDKFSHLLEALIKLASLQVIRACRLPPDCILLNVHAHADFFRYVG